MQGRRQIGSGKRNSGQDLRPEQAERRMELCMSVQSAIGQSWMTRHWNFGIVQSVMGIMSIVRIICLPIST